MLTFKTFGTFVAAALVLKSCQLVTLSSAPFDDLLFLGQQEHVIPSFSAVVNNTMIASDQNSNNIYLQNNWDEIFTQPYPNATLEFTRDLIMTTPNRPCGQIKCLF